MIEEYDKVKERDLSFYIYLKYKIRASSIDDYLQLKTENHYMIKSNSIRSVSNLYLFIDKYFGEEKKKEIKISIQINEEKIEKSW